jgi:hypothetical protein
MPIRLLTNLSKGRIRLIEKKEKAQSDMIERAKEDEKANKNRRR